MARLHDAFRAAHAWIWERDLRTAPRWRRALTRALRMGQIIGREVLEGQLTLEAMSLVYTTLLSLVPLLAVSFSVLKGFGVHSQIEPTLRQFLDPLGPQASEVTDRIIGFVENVDVGVLGSVGLVFLLYTVITLVQKIERSFNYVWHVKRLRPLSQRFADYLSVLLIGPVLMFTVMGVTTSFMSMEVVQDVIAIRPFGWLVDMATALVPYLLIIGAFTFLYVFMPNTRVRLRSALVGALVGGVLWQSVGWGFAAMMVGSTRYTAIYSGFAILIVFMIWVYLAWLILLVGASIAFYHQHPEYLTTRRREPRLSSRMKERLALLAMVQIGRNHYARSPALTAEVLARRVMMPTHVVEEVLDSLVGCGFLVQTGGEPPAYVPALALDAIRIADLLEEVRSAEEDGHISVGRLPREPAVDDLFHRLGSAVDTALAETSLRDLVHADLSARPTVPAEGAPDAAV